MTLTDHDGQALTPEDLAFLRAHPRLWRLAVKAHKLDHSTGTPDALIPEVLLRWATALLPSPSAPPPKALDATRKHSIRKDLI